MVAENPNLNAIVARTLEQQVDLLTSQRDILARIELLLTRLIEIKTASRDTGTNHGTIQNLFANRG